jgi:ATP-binding cassette subfamily F protein 3
MHFYSGNYEKYLSQKTERREQLISAYKNQRERIEALEAFINRFRAQATKAKQVQSRIKELEKIERIEIPTEEKAIHFSFPQPKPSGRNVAEFHGVSKSYGEKHVFSGVNFTIERGERIALVGHNGAGKSTLIKLLAGTEPVSKGEYLLGHNVELDYFAQDQYKELDPEARMLDDLTSLAGLKTQTELRGLLGCFLFSEDDVFKRIGVLSGGERNRYALCKMMLRPSNFILLDEPTNHLDLRAKDILLNALESYTGTVVFVSHDRYFIDKLATKVYEVGDGGVEVYPGNYEEYIWRKSGGAQKMQAEIVQRQQPAAAAPSAPTAPAPEAAPKKKINPIKLKQLQDRVVQLEADIASTEAAMTDTEAKLSNYSNADESARLGTALAALREKHEKLLADWESTSEALAEVS